mmetsp:Transcript_8649/g.9858  ORF Transcript_8649/g.9858 Transcript_8649/m.9858 type:complete len:363 (-) Transcript_8649:364-1452(-)
MTQGGEKEQTLFDSHGKTKGRISLVAVISSVLFLWISLLWDDRIPFNDNIFGVVIGTFYSVYGEIHTAGSDPRYINSLRLLANIANNITFSSKHMSIENEVWIPRQKGRGSGLINVVVMRPKLAPKDKLLPLVVWFHGGGMVLGKAIDGSIPMSLLLHMNVTIASVNYRLAPENPFPAAYDDALSVLEYFASDASIAASIGGDIHRLVVAGESAGGNLAAGVTQAARDRGIAIAYQALFIPMLGYRFDTESYIENSNCPVLPAETVKWFWDKYVPDPRRCTNSSACQPLIGNTNGLPPTLVFTASCDVLRDDGIDYVRKLQNSGVQVDHIHAEGSHFGVTMFQGQKLQQAFRLIREALEKSQ